MINSGNKKIALVTGATGYLGKQICSDLIREGYFVVLSDLNFDELTEFQASIQPELRVYTSILPINLSNIDDILVQSKNLCSKLPRLDLIVNNAAMTGKSAPENYMSSLENQDEFLFLEGLKINLLAPFAIIKNLLPIMQATKGANIINICSIYGLVGNTKEIYTGSNLGTPATYAASKGGLVQLTRYLAIMLSPGIRVNGVAPGGIERNQDQGFIQKYNKIVPLERMATEAEISKVVLWMASDSASYITGQILPVDGGWTAK